MNTNSSFEHIQKCILDAAARGCSSFSFAAVQDEDYLYRLVEYFTDKGYAVHFSGTDNFRRFLVKISW